MRKNHIYQLALVSFCIIGSDFQIQYTLMFRVDNVKLKKVLLKLWQQCYFKLNNEYSWIVLSDSTTITVTIDSCKNITIVNSITIVDVFIGHYITHLLIFI